MNIIGVDTSAAYCSVGVAGDTVNPVERNEPVGNEFNETLFELLSDALTQAGLVRRGRISLRLKKRAINGIAVNIGPGSFTGIRVGLSAAKGLAHSLSVPITGVTAYEALAHKADPKDFPLCCIVPLKGEKISYLIYKSPGAVDGSEAGEAGTWNDVIQKLQGVNSICGDIPDEKVHLLKINVSPDVSVIKRKPSGIAVAEIGMQKLQCGVSDDMVSLSPIYMHAAAFRKQVTMKGRK